MTTAISDWLSFAGDWDLYQGVRRLHHHQQCEKPKWPLSNIFRCSDFEFIRWGTRWTRGRGTWWSRSSWGRPSSTSTSSLRTGMRWLWHKMFGIHSKSVTRNILLFRWIWISGCSTLKLICFPYTPTSPRITYKQTKMRKKDNLRKWRKERFLKETKNIF